VVEESSQRLSALEGVDATAARLTGESQRLREKLEQAEGQVRALLCVRVIGRMFALGLGFQNSLLGASGAGAWSSMRYPTRFEHLKLHISPILT
jgi:hypothetical protein